MARDTDQVYWDILCALRHRGAMDMVDLMREVPGSVTAINVAVNQLIQWNWVERSHGARAWYVTWEGSAVVDDIYPEYLQERTALDQKKVRRENEAQTLRVLMEERRMDSIRLIAESAAKMDKQRGLANIWGSLWREWIDDTDHIAYPATPVPPLYATREGRRRYQEMIEEPDEYDDDEWGTRGVGGKRSVGSWVS